MAKTIDDYIAPQADEKQPLPIYRALMNLHYSDLVREIGLPEMAGVLHTMQGDTTTLYWPLRKYKERIEILKRMGAIEEIIQPKIVTVPEEK